MAVIHWTRDEAISDFVALRVDDLGDAGAVVLHDVGTDDAEALAWCQWAPCVVVAAPSDMPPPDAVDVQAVDDRELLAMLSVIEERPRSAKALVDVLRIMPSVSPARGLTLESFAYSLLLGGPEFRAWMESRAPLQRKRFSRPPVVTERVGDVLRVTMDRAENRNAFSAEMRDTLFHELAVAESDPSIATIELRGNGPVFSSGGDLTEFGTTPDVGLAHRIRLRHSVGARLARMSDRVTVHVHGPCVGAGVELAGFAGTVVADPATTFRLPEIEMGLIPGAGGTVSLTHRIGRHATARLALLGLPIGVEEAGAIGLVDRIEPVAG